MVDWLAAHLDLSHQTALRLMQVANADDPEIDAALTSGRWGLDRASLLVKLGNTGASPELFSEAAEKYSLGWLYGLVDRLRHLSPVDEQDLFEYRYLVIQPNLDESAFKLCDLGEAIPPQLRSFILWRDQGQCSIEGCQSRYRLQPHHIQHRNQGGTHDPTNLISLCWFHHHVAIHQMGFQIDPSTPTHRRRLLRPKNRHGP